MSMTDAQAAQAIKAHHTEMRNELRRRVDALEETVRSGAGYEHAHSDVLDYLEGELLPHAQAEEKALYPAGDTGPSALLVRSMREEHRTIIGRVAALRNASDAVAAAMGASAVLALFESHLWKENELLIPNLVADPDVAMAELLAGMHELIGEPTA